MAKATARPLYSSSSPRAVPLSIPRARQPGWPLWPPLLQLVDTRQPPNRWLRKPALQRLKPLRRMTTRTFACRGRRWCQWITGSSRLCSTRFLRTLGHRMQCLFFTTHAGTRVAAVVWCFQHHFIRACLGLTTWWKWRFERGYGGDRIAVGGLDVAYREASCGSRCFHG